MTNHKSIDGPSVKSQFGWELIGSEQLPIPVILRNNDIRYCPVRIVEQEIIKKYDSLPQSVFQCITLKSFYITAAEAKLLNKINFEHCNCYYGETMFGLKDVILSASDVTDLCRYLSISEKFFNGDPSDLKGKFGLIRIRVDPTAGEYYVIVPYLGKSYPQSKDGGRFIPLKLVENYIDKKSIRVQGKPNDWDVMYLKMLNLYSKNSNPDMITSEDFIILLDDLTYSVGGNVIWDEFRPV